MVAEAPSYYSRLSSYTQILSADTLVYLALRVTGRFICVKTYQFAEINGNIRHPASAPCFGTLLRTQHSPPSQQTGCSGPRVSILQAGHPRSREPPARFPLEEQVTPLAA